MMLEISRIVLDRVRAASRAALPNEACGLLFGSDHRIDDCRGTANVADCPATGFEIDPSALIAAFRAEREGGARVVGYWHSHPNGVARPSAVDRDRASPDWRIWLIVAGDTVTAWRATPHGLQPVNFTAA